MVFKLNIKILVFLFGFQIDEINLLEIDFKVDSHKIDFIVVGP